MGDHIIGIKAVHEVSLTRKAANQHCVKVLQKNLGAGNAHIIHPNDPPEDPTTEESAMDAKIVKSFAGLQARTGTAGALYVAQLEDDKVKSFFDQDAAAQDAEVTAWDSAEKAKAADLAEKEKAKAAGDPEVEKLKAELAELKSERTIEKSAARIREIEKAAAKDYPLVPTAVDILKSIDGLSADDQKPTHDLLKSQQAMAAKMKAAFGADDAPMGDAATRHGALVTEVAKAKSLSIPEATVLVAEDPANAALIREMRDEAA